MLPNDPGLFEESEECPRRNRDPCCASSTKNRRRRTCAVCRWSILWKPPPKDTNVKSLWRASTSFTHAEQGYSIAEAARSLGLSDNLIRNWKQALQDKGQQAFPGHGKLSPFEEENHRLRAENKRLLAERDILKKAAAFFAREAT